MNLSSFTKTQLTKIVQELYQRHPSSVHEITQRITRPGVECPRCHNMGYQLVCHTCQTHFCYSCSVRCSRCAYTGGGELCPTCNGSTEKCNGGTICYRCCVTDGRGFYCLTHNCFNDDFDNDCVYVGPADERFQEALIRSSLTS